jgi:hypothetical protein
LSRFGSPNGGLLTRREFITGALDLVTAAIVGANAQMEGAND